MQFKLNVNLTDKDYVDFNIFWAIKSPYSKKQMIKFRVLLAVLTAALALISLYGGKFSSEAFINIIPLIICSVVFQLLLKPTYTWALKSQLRSLKKAGKLGYDPISQIEFYENELVEITPTNKTEQKYSVFERVSIIGNKMIYIHHNTVRAYILPRSCFESQEQYSAFIDFIKTKCENIDTY